jgi:uncharacterized protein with HEPN domain|tara:strand:- start:56 stop:400 length:345 start_codon:yes stop_codon:yes gene_type:complete
MKRDVNLYLTDILESINFIKRYTRGFSAEKFKRDKKSQDAVIRRLEIIGEATKKIPNEIKKQYPQVRWQEIAGVRDFLSHIYFGVNLNRIWRIIKDDLPKLNNEIKNIVKKLNQ